MRFMDENFLLKTKTSQKLFFDYANKMPIFDFHCHLNPKDIYENNNFKDITEAWLLADHYKWRLMRSVGIDEKYITGDGTGLEKFKAFAKTLEFAIGNPIYHWAHLELKTYFDINEPLTEKNAEKIYSDVNEMLRQKDFKVRNFIEKSRVNIVVTTDDPIDTLEWHEKIKQDEGFKTKVLPAFRPDRAINIEISTFADYINQLATVSDIKINSFDELKKALASRIEHFTKHGCVASDHGIKYVPFAEFSLDEIDPILKKALNKENLTQLEIDKYKTALLQFLAKEYSKRNWVMEIHYGVLRNINTDMFEKLGPDTGYDTIGDYNMVDSLSSLLNLMNKDGNLPKTILFSGNPGDNYLLGTMMQAFQAAGDVSKIQLGTAWWFNDHINGMTNQINALADVGVLGKFIGMLTDSRSFLSYTRHEYFRRIICSIIGEWVEEGHYNPDIEVVGKLVENISYNNAMEYFFGSTK